MRFDYRPGVGAVLGVGKLYPDSGFAITRSAMGSNPDYFTRDGETFFELHHGEQEKHFIAQAEALLLHFFAFASYSPEMLIEPRFAIACP